MLARRYTLCYGARQFCPISKGARRNEQYEVMCCDERLFAYSKEGRKTSGCIYLGLTQAAKGAR
jgi:hypothetical protein